MVKSYVKKPRSDSEQRANILEAAIPVFAEKGRKGASIRLVAQAAGVNSALIYYYFENKDMLFREAVRSVVLGMLEQLQTGLRPFANAHERLGYLVNCIMDYYSAHPNRMRLMGIVHALYGEVLGQVLQDTVTKVRLVPLEILQEGMTLGQIKPANPLQIWWSLLGSCVFTLFMSDAVSHVNPAVLPVKIPSLEEHRQQIIGLFCDGLAANAKTKHKTTLK
ncbi:MAG: TetR/AcrR family transcriptional regulator [Verrucomicrobiota bacterium]